VCIRLQAEIAWSDDVCINTAVCEPDGNGLTCLGREGGELIRGLKPPNPRSVAERLRGWLRDHT
jgi:hypothetical protein